MDLAKEKAELEQQQKQLVANLNYVAGQLAFIERLERGDAPAEETLPGETSVADALAEEAVQPNGLDRPRRGRPRKVPVEAS